MNENLQKAAELGQGIWIDSISRDDLVDGGALHQMIEDGVVGVTSNPSIFQKAISESELYDEQLEESAKETDDPKEIFWQLAVKDIQDACDILAPVYERTAGKDGFVSLEVSPDIGYDAPKTVDEALMLHGLVDRPNLLVKIPATQPGLAAIEEVIRNGKSVNVTLIFSLERYKAVARAYIRGLQRLVAEGGDPSGVASVASFFVSRVDSEGDQRPRRRRAAGPQRPAGYREREAGVRGVRGDLLRLTIGSFGVERREQAASALGLDVDQKPRLPGHHLRRQPSGSGYGQHDAGRDARGDDGPRRDTPDA